MISSHHGGMTLKPQDDLASVALLKDCANHKDLHKGILAHADILKKGLLQKNIFIGNTLIHLYAKCGALVRAQQVLDQLSRRNVVSWNALLAGYAQHGKDEEAIDCFEWMQSDGLSPDAVTFACILKACGSIGSYEKGQDIHSEIVRRGLLGKDVVLGNALVDMYAKCGALAKAQQVFDKLLIRNVVSWTALITGFCRHKHGEESFKCYELMKEEGLSADSVTFACILKTCGTVGAAERGQEVHAEILKEGSLGKTSVLGSALVEMYANCGALRKAQQVLDELQAHDEVSWNALIAGSCQYAGEDALMCFEWMKSKDIHPDAATFTCILKACGCIGAVEKGKEIHAEIMRKGLLEDDIVLGNALVDMYAKCGSLSRAQEVFNNLLVRDAVSWTALLVGYCKHGHLEEAIECFEWMTREGLSPDAVTFDCILKACGGIGAVENGIEIHAAMIREGLLGKASVLESSLVDMYAKCGALTKAQFVFEDLAVRDVMACNALITGYSQYGPGEEALKCFERMKCEGISPDDGTFSCILKACGSIGAAEKGREIHADIVREGFLKKTCALGSGLIDMYGKCGALAQAREVFDELFVRDVVSWTALITAYCDHGHGKEALACFERMIDEGLSPDVVTFACILKACGSIGETDKGLMFFESMCSRFGIMPILEHYTCMVVIFGRTGHFDRAMAIMKKMPSSHYLPVWFALLSTCRKLGNLKLGRLAFEHA